MAVITERDPAREEFPMKNNPSDRAESPAIEALRKSEERFRVLFESGPVAVYSCDTSGVIREFNRRAAELWGREPKLGDTDERFCGSFRMIRPDGSIMGHAQCPMAEVLCGRIQEARDAEVLIEQPDGSRVSVVVNIRPLTNQGGEVTAAINCFYDITERKLAEEATAKLAAIIESSDDAIISKDLNGVITSWNSGATQLFGYTADEVIGRPITMLMPPERVDEEPGILDRIRRGDRIDQYDTVRRRKDGTLLDISLTVSPVMNAQGKVVGASKIARDITDRKRAERALLEADRQKNEFLATLAHELRNPLAPIQNSLNILSLTHGDDPAAARVHEMMERQVNHMVRLVDDLLDISRITTGKIDLRLEPVEIASVIRHAVETSRPQIDAGRHQLALTLSPEPLTVDGDPVRLAQVVANLLNNSAKYTEPGGQIWLAVSRRGGEVLITVRDNCIGISADLLPHVLEMFTQAVRDKKRPQDGLGIGLALVKRLVEMHGGSVLAKSDGEGRGSEFTVRLPLSQQQLSIHEEMPQVDRAGRFTSRQRILVVDDNPDAASTLGMLLKILGSDVETAPDGQSVLQVLDSFRATVALLDLGMPGMSGYELAQRMRDLPQFRDITLVALTGWGQEEDRRRTREAGFDHHLVKPVNLAALQMLLAEVPCRQPGTSSPETLNDRSVQPGVRQETD
jgi:PAS domain S-box-containing protein